MAPSMSSVDFGGGSGSRGRSVGRGLDSSLENYQQLLASAGEFMSDEIEKLPLRKYE